MEEARITGRRVGGFTIGPRVADGGMGSVYQASRPDSSDLFAIKIMLTEHDGNDEYRQRFIRETKLMQTLKHPNITPVFAAGEEQDMLYFVMPLVRGPSVFDLLRRRRFSPLTAWQIFSPVAQALDYAHHRGVIHRDIKPSNILIETQDGKAHHVYLVDFGLSKIDGLKTLTKSGVSMGTPHYMAPEQVQAKPLSPQSDIYSLGVVLFELLLGQLPFQASNPYKIALKHLRDAPPLPRTLHADFPLVLEQVLMQALAKEPLQRFASAEVFRMAYANAVQALDKQARQREYWPPTK